MNRIAVVVFATAVLFLSGCATMNPISKKDAFPKMYQEHPASILVVPAVNNSTAADAPDLYSSTILEPLANSGYYVLPIEVTTEILRREGIQNGAQLVDVPAQKFGELFGSDAVLFVSINSWDTNYYVIGGNVTVGLSFTLKSTKTNEMLWHYNDVVVLDTSGDSNNGGGLIGLLIGTAIKTAMQDYVTVARDVNKSALTSIPKGKYHPGYQMDQGSKSVHASKL